VIGGVILGLLLAAVFARRSESFGSGLVNFLGAAWLTVPASTVAVFLVAFWFITGRPPIDIFRLGPDVPPASSAREYTEHYLNGQIKIKGRRTEGQFGSHFGPHNAWYSNGQKAFERTFDEKVPFSNYRRKQWTEWHENGVKKAQRLPMPNEYEEVEGPYHDRITQWYDNGQKYTEGDVRHGENAAKIPNWLGSHREWYASGQLKCEWLEINDGVKAWYENGKPLFENLDSRSGSKGKFWDEQGNISERHQPEDVCPQYKILYLTEADLVENHPFDGR
jgi:antitoxin component YwqK of YwqJK toxin-antitoxin module